MSQFEIYFNDLTRPAQARYLQFMGVIIPEGLNGIDTMPIAILEGEDTDRAKSLETLLNFAGYKFKSSSETTDDFKLFAKLFINHIKQELVIYPDMVLEDYTVGHYTLSGFIRKDSRYVYFLIPDVRYHWDNWKDEIIIRRAMSLHDFCGANNWYVKLEEFMPKVQQLMTFRLTSHKDRKGQSS